MSSAQTSFTTGSSQPKKATGQLHSIKGSIVENIGKVTGSTSMKHHGKEEHAAGQAEIDAAKAKGYAQGTGDRVTGKKDSVVGAVTGDKHQQMQGNMRGNKGEAQQNMNKFH